MYRYKTAELCRKVDILKDVNDKLTGTWQKTQQEMWELLAECQKLAIEIGNDIENREAENGVIITLLEEYCEKIYEQSEYICKDRGKCDKLRKEINILLEKIKKKIETMLVDLKDIIFLPYKYSMWDCMESIWIAACNDNRCRSLVIPIPYYDRNSDGSFGMMRYEGELFPESMNIINWQEYDFEQNKPEVIYIHNPYDQYNYVTSVHPDFYSDKLKNITNQLVYIPYFFTSDRLPDSHLKLPVYYYADKIIVQNLECKSQLKKVVDRNKVLSLGNPKLDILLSKKNEKRFLLELGLHSEERKVILFNTSISMFLKNTDALMSKIAQLVQVFKKSNDLLVIWRPHPLLETTLKSMRPQYSPVLTSLQNAFAENKNCILDKGMNLDDLVAGADAYIGEASSSIAAMFLSLGKPVFLINEQLENFAEYEAFFDFFLDDNRFIFFHNELNIICEADFETGIIDKIVFPESGEDFVGTRYYTDFIEKDKKIYMTPFQAKKILCVNSDTLDYHFISFITARETNFCRGHINNNVIFFIPTRNNAILQYNLEDQTIHYHKKPINQIKHHSMEKGYYSMFASCMVDNELYIAAPTSNYLFIYNVQTEKMKEIYIKCSNQGFWDMVYDGENFWLNPYIGIAIIRWNPKSGEIKEYRNYPDGFSAGSGEKDCFIRLVDCDSFLLAFPKNANMIIKLDKMTGLMEEYYLDLPYREGERRSKAYKWVNYYFAKRVENQVYALSGYDHGLLIIDIITKKCSIKHFSFSKKTKCQINEKILTHKKRKNIWDFAYYENRYFTAEDFLTLLLCGKITDSQTLQRLFLKNLENSDGTSGEKIHRRIMEDI